MASLSGCLPKALSQWPCQTAFRGSQAFDRRIDCMYLYFTEKNQQSIAWGFGCLSTSFMIVGEGNVSHFHLSVWTRRMLFQVSNGGVRQIKSSGQGCSYSYTIHLATASTSRVLDNTVITLNICQVMWIITKISQILLYTHSKELLREKKSSFYL